MMCTIFSVFQCVCVPSVLWCCWLDGRKGIQPVKNVSDGVLACLSVLRELQTFLWPSWCHCHSRSLASVKSRLVLPFWYRLTRVVPEKGLLNGCVCKMCHCNSLFLASVKSRLVLPFGYWLTWVIPDKGPLNECVCQALYSSTGVSLQATSCVWQDCGRLWWWHGPPVRWRWYLC